MTRMTGRSAQAKAPRRLDGRAGASEQGGQEHRDGREKLLECA